MLAIIITLFCILIFPIFLNGKFYFTKDKLKLFYKINLFGFIKVLKGYAEIIDEGIILHLTKKKAVLIPFDNVFDIRKTVEPLRDYHLVTARLYLRIGSSESDLLPLTTAFIVNYINNYVKWFFYHRKPYFNLDTKIDVFCDDQIFQIYFNGTVVFNLLMILLSLIKILTGKIIYALAK